MGLAYNKSVNDFQGEKMIKKTLMVTLYILIGYQCMAAVHAPMTPADRGIASQAPEQNICMIQSGDVGKLKYKGTSMSDAFQKVTEECFQKRNQLFAKRNNQEADQDRQILFAESCANSVKCI